MRWWQESPVTGESAKETVKTIAQGRRDCLRWTCMLVCTFLTTLRTRDRGCSVHPAFPAPSAFLRGCKVTQSSGISCRENADPCPSWCMTL